MKKLLLVIVTILWMNPADAKGFKDELYNEYVSAYMKEMMENRDITHLFFTTAERVFSVQNKVMRNAIKQSRMKDSAAIVQLGKETMTRFLNEKFLPLSCDHFKDDMLPIVKTYTEPLCTNITAIMSKKGNLQGSKLDEAVQQAMTDASIAMAKDSKFAEKTEKLRREVGQRKIMDALECNFPYVYKNCPYMRNYLLNASVEKAIAKYTEYKRKGQKK